MIDASDNGRTLHSRKIHPSIIILFVPASDVDVDDNVAAFFATHHVPSRLELLRHTPGGRLQPK